MTRPSRYELREIQKIRRWQRSGPGLLGQAFRTINRPLESLMNRAIEAPGVEWAVSKTVGGLISIMNDLAHWSVRPEAIYREFKDRGCLVNAPGDAFHLDLRQVDRVMGTLAVKYRRMAALEGAATGVFGLVGISADIVALIALNQRAVAEYATYCGFDISLQAERLYAIRVLGRAADPPDAAGREPLTEWVGADAGDREIRGLGSLEKQTFMDMVQKGARILASRLIRIKVGQSIPGVGLGVGAGLNAMYTGRVCDAAFHLYRARFLVEKYGRDILGGGFPSSGVDRGGFFND